MGLSVVLGSPLKNAGYDSVMSLRAALTMRTMMPGWLNAVFMAAQTALL